MKPYTEPAICISGIPDLVVKPCPSTLVAPAPTDLELTLSMQTYEYKGVVRTDLPDRINRINLLILELWRRVNYIAWSFSTVFTHTFKYPSVEPRVVPIPDKKVTGSAFDIMHKMMVEVDTKLDLITIELGSIRPVASVPEHWQIRPEANRPMAIFLFGEVHAGKAKIDSPKWQIAVPHAMLGALNGFDNTFGYTKGSYQKILTLADNSKIIFYGDNETQMDAVLARWRQVIAPAMLSGSFVKGGTIRGLPFSVRVLRLTRIDYYATGLLNTNPDKVIYFPREIS